MKKLLKITGIIIITLLVIILAVPFLFQGKIMKIAKEQINTSLNAKAGFGKLSLSLFKTFPNVSVGLKDFYIAGLGEFEGDTLVSFSSAEVVVDLISAIKMENIRIKRIVIDEPVVHAWVLPSGRVNWDIVKDTGEEQDTDTATTDMNMKIELKRFEINHANISYDDDSSKISASLDDFNFAMTGDLSQDFSTLKMNSTTEKLNVVYGGIRYLRDAALILKIDVDADLKNALYTLKDNSVALNDLVLKFDGNVGMPNEEDITVDMKYGLAETDFKSLLSLIPAIYMKDFQDVRTMGKLMLDGTVKGTYNEQVMPSVLLNLLVENAMFRYPDLPKSAENIGIDVKLFFDGVQNDNTTVDVNKFHVELGGNPVDMTLNIKTPMSDMHINGNVNMDLNLATINDVIPLDSTTLNGEIKATLDFMGYMSYIEKEEYEKFKADGSMLIKNFIYASPDLPRDLSITEASLAFSPKFLEVSKFDAIMGKSDFHVSGKIEDFIPYVFKDETIKGNFIFTSGVLDLNEFMTESVETTEVTDTVPLSVIEVPANVDFRLVSRIDKLYYDNLEIENMIGTILVKESRVVLDGVKMNLLDGSMQLSGEYNTKDVKSPMVDFDFKATAIDIPAAFSSFSTLQQFAPIASRAVGKVSLGMKYASYLDENMMPLLKSIVGKGSFSSDLIGLKNSTTFDKIGDALKTNAFDNMVLSNLGVNFDIRDGRLMVNPFETKMGKSTLLIGGDQGLDQTMNYTVGITIPRSELGAAANAPIDNLMSKATGAGLKIDPFENLNIRVKVGGTFRDPKIGLDLADNTSKTKDILKEQVIQAVQEQIDTKKEEARAAAQAEVDKIMAQARKEADLITQKAADAADLVRKEANTNAETLVSKAKDPISKRLAEEGAKKLRQEGENAAQKIIKEADSKAVLVLNTAKEQGDKLLNE
ncbi:MAG TPA: AsmA-like C-terminal region-containing protein [Bacteroidales bacterium]|nr:AsmA-like C-terminal region-containing protein [Bacteroidales bacterium]